MERFEEQRLEAVLPALRAGAALRRRSWPGLMQIFICEDIEYLPGSSAWVLGMKDRRGAVGAPRVGQLTYELSVDDLLATDWLVLPSGDDGRVAPASA